MAPGRAEEWRSHGGHGGAVEVHELRVATDGEEPVHGAPNSSPGRGCGAPDAMAPTIIDCLGRSQVGARRVTSPASDTGSSVRRTGRHHLLPVGLLRGRTGGAVLAGENRAASSSAVEFIRIVAVNLSLVGIVLVARNVLRTRRGVPMGHRSAAMMIAVAGVVTGTNSFSIRVGSARKPAPSFELLGDPGPYEFAAHVVAATATYGSGRWQLVRRWPHSTAPRLAAEPMTVCDVVPGLCATVAILFAMGTWEASRIISAVGRRSCFSAGGELTPVRAHGTGIDRGRPLSPVVMSRQMGSGPSPLSTAANAAESGDGRTRLARPGPHRG